MLCDLCWVSLICLLLPCLTPLDYLLDYYTSPHQQQYSRCVILLVNIYSTISIKYCFLKRCSCPFADCVYLANCLGYKLIAHFFVWLTNHKKQTTPQTITLNSSVLKASALKYNSFDTWKSCLLWSVFLWKCDEQIHVAFIIWMRLIYFL